MVTTKEHHYRHARPVCKSLHRALFLLALCFLPLAARAQDDPSTQYRLTLSMTAPIIDKLDANPAIAFFANPDLSTQTYRFQWPSVTWLTTRWLQLSGGLLTQYSDHKDAANTLQLRPFAGVKLFVPNNAHLVLYNFTRYEYLTTENLDSNQWSSFSRIRSQFMAEIPLVSGERAWQPKTWYTLVSVEPFYRFDTDQLTPLRVGAGIGRVLKDKVRVELTYQAQFSRPDNGALAWTENIVQLQFRIGLRQGVLGQLLNPTEKE